jgi:hypothetical protein
LVLEIPSDLDEQGTTDEKRFDRVTVETFEKVAADIDSLKAGVAQAKHDLDARQAEHHAEKREWEAGVAIDYAIASVEQAKLAVLDAVSSRAEAERAKTS